jgi:hypothetical protein
MCADSHSPRDDGVLPRWLSRRILPVKRTGHFFFAGDPFFDPTFLSHPTITALVRIVKVLDISRTTVNSLTGLPFFPRLSVFVADRTLIATFENFKAVRSALTVSLKDSPVSKLTAFRVSILLAFGSQNRVSSIDGGLVTQSLKDQASAYSNRCTALLDCGWIPSIRPPALSELQGLCEQYGVPPPTELSESSPLSSSVAESSEPSDFDGLLSALKEEEREVWRKGKAQFGLLNNDDDNLNDDVMAILQRHQIADRSSHNVDIVATVAALCAELDPDEGSEDDLQ